MNARVDYWDRIYAAEAIGRPAVPSQFAAFAANECRSAQEPVDCLVDVGCGSGRDTFFLAQFAATTIGIDASRVAIDVSTWRGGAVRFHTCDFDDGRQCDQTLETIVSSLAGGRVRRLCIYTRFFLHAVDEAAEGNFLDFCSRLAARFRETLVMAEYRTSGDRDRLKRTPEHYRRFIDHGAFVAGLRASGFAIRYDVEGRGMAKHGQDDAVVGRVVASWGRGVP